MKSGVFFPPSVVKFFTNPAVVIAGIFLLAAPRAGAFDDTPPPLLLTIVGDSTVASYDAKSPIHGWGEFIAPRMRRRVQVHNAAVPGASSTSFLRENRWEAALREKPAVVLIQFGHNDSGQSINPLQTQANLQFFIESARAQGATPVLVTPMQLRVFRRDKFLPTLRPYADAARQVAARNGIPLIDLNELSGQLFEQLGPVKTEQLASPGGDRTHFNQLGAQAMGEIVLHELSQMRTPLMREIIAPGGAATLPAATPKPANPPAKAAKRRR